jgi:uncharacterized OsmC-like protein
MALLPGTIDLGKFRVVYEEERRRSPDTADGYFLQQRAIIRLNEDLVKIEQCEDYTVYCDDANFRKEAGKRPSPLQYFIASVGFCMFSQLKRLAIRANVPIQDLEMDLRITYDLTGKFPTADFSSAAQGLSYLFRIQSTASIEKISQVAQLTDRSCHTVNSMRKRMPVAGKLSVDGREYDIAIERDQVMVQV